MYQLIVLPPGDKGEERVGLSAFPSLSASDCGGIGEKDCAFEDTFSKCKVNSSTYGCLRNVARGEAGAVPGGHGSFSGKRCVLGQKLCLLILLI